MQNTHFSGVILVALTLSCTACNNNNYLPAKKESKMEQTESNKALPTTDRWVKSPVRNRLVLELNKPVAEVWALAGDPANMPEFSPGIDSVITKKVNGRCTQYTCYFKPMKEGESGYVHTENMIWSEENKGWASRSPEPNAMGYTDYLSLITLEALPNNKTRLTWAMTSNHNNQEMIDQNTKGLVEAFDNIGRQLTARFGGKVVENHSEK
ncbi:MAG TPA: SRPBCC family protein [Sediminibacterium sp.]|nr:SRPBCC family protein [Sediminibacterium sp.]